MNAHQSCEAALIRQAPFSNRVQLKNGARRLLEKPFPRIQINIFGFGFLGKLPDDVDDLIGYCRRHPGGRHPGNPMAIKQALLALRVLRRRGVVSVCEPVKPRIVTHHVFPPIPIRTMDWCAFRDGREEEGGYGWGPTKEAAIADLLENEEASK